MLELPRYLLGTAEILWLAGFAWLGAAALRARLVPSLSGAPAHLGTAVLALAQLLVTAELLGTFSLLAPIPYLALVAALGVGIGTLLPRVAWGEGGAAGAVVLDHSHPTPPAGRSTAVPSLIALAIAALAVLKFGLELRPSLGAGMTGFDTTWYHGPFAAGFAESGDTWSLHLIAPQFLAWFYPANAEILHGVGILAYGRDLLSPLLNLGWFLGCLLACWCLGRPYGVAPWSLALGAVALSLPALADQAGEARNDIVGIFFLLAAAAVLLNAWAAVREQSGEGGGLPRGALFLVALAAGLAAGTKLNYLPPAAVLVLGAALPAPRGRRAASLGIGAAAALLGGGYWYLRNLVHAGNPLPWFTDLGPLTLPGPEQELGGREGHSVLGYLADGAVWSEWLLPGLRDGLTVLWPVFGALALAGVALALGAARRGSGRDGALALAGLAALAAALAWLVAPTSASGPEGMPRGFESGLRYLAPALVLGLALLPAAPSLRRRLASLLSRSSFPSPVGKKDEREAGSGPGLGSGLGLGPGWPSRRVRAGLATAALLAAVAIGYPVQRHYLENRYSDPTFSSPGLDAAFAWAREVTGARIATTGTRQYPLLGTDLSNEVQFVGAHRPQGGFLAPSDCQTWRRLLNEGDYDYVVATRDRPEPGKPPYPPSATWTESPQTTAILRQPPTVVFRIQGPLPPSSCP